jgi:hypothetical protein
VPEKYWQTKTKQADALAKSPIEQSLADCNLVSFIGLKSLLKTFSIGILCLI